MARILIAEDFPDIRNILGLLLTTSGHEIIEASDGREAVEKAVSEQPDLILMDMSMPVLSGWDATRKVKADPKTAHIPVIALTAHALKGDKERAWQAGCDGFITKPIDNELLEHTIEQILSHGQDSDEQTGMAPEEIAVQETTRRSTDKLLNIHNQHILIIDEDHDTADYISGELRSRGYRTSVAERREQAFSLMETDPVDLVVCEIELPDASGYEITEQIKANSQMPFTPVILVTEGEIDWERALVAGADDFLAKPINPSKLLVRVRSLVRLKQAVASESGRANELASVLSQMMTGLIIADAEGVVTVVNGRGLEILGIPLDEVIGIQIDDMIGKLNLRDEGCDDFNPAEFPLSRALKQDEALAKQLTCVRRRDGAELILSFNAAPIYNEHGQKIGAVSLFDDITGAIENLKQDDSQVIKISTGPNFASRRSPRRRCRHRRQCRSRIPSVSLTMRLTASLTFDLGAPVDHHRGALGRQALGDREADARGRAGDEGALAREFQIHAVLSLASSYARPASRAKPASRSAFRSSTSSSPACSRSAGPSACHLVAVR